MTLSASGTRRRIGLNFLWKAAAEASRGFQIVYFILLARRLGAASFGRFSVGYAAAMFLASLGDCGLNVLLTRDVAGDKSKGAPLFLQITYAKVVLFALFLAGVSLWPAFASERGIVLLFLALAAGRNLVDQLSYFCLAYEKLKVESWMKLVLGCFTLGLGLAALSLRPTVGAAVLALLLAHALAALIGLILIARQVTALPRPASWPLPRWPSAEMGEVAALALINLALAGFSRVDIACLKWFGVGADETGRYFAAERVIAGIGMLPGLFAIASLPVFSGLQKGTVRQTASRLRLELFLGGCLAATACALGARLGTRLIYGPAYASTAKYLIWLSLALPFMFINHFSLNALIGAKRSAAAAAAAVGAIAFNLILDLLLIPRLGAAGAALAMAGAQGVLALLCWPLFGIRTADLPAEAR